MRKRNERVVGIIPFCEELKDEILAFLGKPRLIVNVKLDLGQVRAQNLRSEIGHEMLCE